MDQAGRISILKHRCHVGRYLAGEQVAVESRDGLLHVTHNGVVIATHARRHLVDQDDKMDRRAAVSRPVRPTKGGEVLRRVDSSGSVSFAGCGYPSATATAARPSVSAWWTTLSKSRKTTGCCEPTELGTTGARSSVRWPTQPDDHEGLEMSHRYRSQSETRVPSPHTRASRM
ncbi:MAG: hypothetical protein ACRDHS_16450 [Actinomycetota bacterium]